MQFLPGKHRNEDIEIRSENADHRYEHDRDENNRRK
jgi:hypothetical protein